MVVKWRWRTSGSGGSGGSGSGGGGGGGGGSEVVVERGEAIMVAVEMADGRAGEVGSLQDT
jgi:hypothetical protein